MKNVYFFRCTFSSRAIVHYRVITERLVNFLDRV